MQDLRPKKPQKPAKAGRDTGIERAGGMAAVCRESEQGSSRNAIPEKTEECRIVKDVLQKRERGKDLFGGAPV